MSDQPNNETALEETVVLQAQDETPRDNLAEKIGQPIAEGSGGDRSAGGSSRQKIRLFEGSRQRLSDEIDDEMLSRLRLASLLLFSGNLSFLIYGFVWKEVPEDAIPLAGTVFPAHVIMTFITGLVALRASIGRNLTKCDASLAAEGEHPSAGNNQALRCKFVSKVRLTGWHLRVSEILVFGGSAIFFLLFTISTMLDAAQYGFFTQLNGPWMLLMFTYAIFMPNDWRRAARVIVPIALCPLLAMTISWFASDAFRQTLRDPRYGGAFPMTMLTATFSSLVAIHGVRTIRSLRKEAFQAQQLGQYRLTRLLGSGGMGDVYEAEHLLLKRACAIKVIKPEQAGDETVLKRFEREVRSTAKLRHWNTIDIYDYGRADDGTFYYVMEFLPGANLQELVDQGGPMPEVRVIHLLKQACEALSEAHAAGMVHRDIKPANIFVTELGQMSDVVKLLDFGLVRPLAATDKDVEITQQNVILGSPLFMPPEQASGEPADTRSDIYSLGVVAYFLLSGRAPFDGNNPLEVIMAHARKPPPPLDAENVSPAVATIVMRCLEKDASQRYQSVEELKHALAAQSINNQEATQLSSVVEPS